MRAICGVITDVNPNDGEATKALNEHDERMEELTKKADEVKAMMEQYEELDAEVELSPDGKTIGIRIMKGDEKVTLKYDPDAKDGKVWKEQIHTKGDDGKYTEVGEPKFYGKSELAKNLEAINQGLIIASSQEGMSPLAASRLGDMHNLVAGQLNPFIGEDGLYGGAMKVTPEDLYHASDRETNELTDTIKMEIADVVEMQLKWDESTDEYTLEATPQGDFTLPEGLMKLAPTSSKKMLKTRLRAVIQLLKQHEGKAEKQEEIDARVGNAFDETAVEKGKAQATLADLEMVQDGDAFQITNLMTGDIITIEYAETDVPAEGDLTNVPAGSYVIDFMPAKGNHTRQLISADEANGYLENGAFVPWFEGQQASWGDKVEAEKAKEMRRLYDAGLLNSLPKSGGGNSIPAAPSGATGSASKTTSNVSSTAVGGVEIDEVKYALIENISADMLKEISVMEIKNAARTSASDRVKIGFEALAAGAKVWSQRDWKPALDAEIYVENRDNGQALDGKTWYGYDNAKFFAQNKRRAREVGRKAPFPMDMLAVLPYDIAAGGEAEYDVLNLGRADWVTAPDGTKLAMLELGGELIVLERDDSASKDVLRHLKNVEDGIPGSDKAWVHRAASYMDVNDKNAHTRNSGAISIMRPSDEYFFDPVTSLIRNVNDEEAGYTPDKPNRQLAASAVAAEMKEKMITPDVYKYSYAVEMETADAAQVVGLALADSGLPGVSYAQNGKMVEISITSELIAKRFAGNDILKSDPSTWGGVAQQMLLDTINNGIEKENKAIEKKNRAVPDIDSQKTERGGKGDWVGKLGQRIGKVQSFLQKGVERRKENREADKEETIARQKARRARRKAKRAGLNPAKGGYDASAPKFRGMEDAPEMEYEDMRGEVEIEKSVPQLADMAELVDRAGVEISEGGFTTVETDTGEQVIFAPDGTRVELKNPATGETQDAFAMVLPPDQGTNEYTVFFDWDTQAFYIPNASGKLDPVVVESGPKGAPKAPAPAPPVGGKNAPPQTLSELGDRTGHPQWPYVNEVPTYGGTIVRNEETGKVALFLEDTLFTCLDPTNPQQLISTFEGIRTDGSNSISFVHNGKMSLYGKDGLFETTNPATGQVVRQFDATGMFYSGEDVHVKKGTDFYQFNAEKQIWLQQQPDQTWIEADPTPILIVEAEPVKPLPDQVDLDNPTEPFVYDPNKEVQQDTTQAQLDAINAQPYAAITEMVHDYNIAPETEVALKQLVDAGFEVEFDSTDTGYRQKRVDIKVTGEGKTGTLIEIISDDTGEYTLTLAAYNDSAGEEIYYEINDPSDAIDRMRQ